MEDYSLDQLSLQVSACIEQFAPRKATTAAKAAAETFVFPPEVFTRDLDDFRAAEHSIAKLARARHLATSPSRFNVERCVTHLCSDPDFEILHTIASSGVSIDVTPLFCPVTTPPQRRRLHTDLLNVYRAHAFKLWSEGHALLIPSAHLKGLNLHFNAAHWTSKPGKPLGRFLCDCSNGVDQGTLNSESLKPLLAKRFGDLVHPTIAQLVSMILQLGEIEGGLSTLLLWKEDIAGAFSHFNYNADDVHLLAIEIDDDLSMIHLTGMFGWSGSPYAFGPFSRALQRLVSKRIRGRVGVYVDDFMGVSLAQFASVDQALAQEAITDVLGPSAINREKSATPCRAAEFIGWLVDLDSASIRPNDRGIRKLVAILFSYDFSAGKKHPIVVYQKLASLASRYSAALYALRPFVHPFYALTSGSGPRACSSMARFAVIVWRTVTLAMVLCPSAFRVPLASLRDDKPAVQWKIVSDAGPHGLGVALFPIESSVCWGYASYRLPFDASSPDFQNAREFLGLIYGLLLCHHARLRNVSIMWVGDNTSSLSWVSKQRSTSRFAQTAFYAYTWICLRMNLEVASTVHLAGAMMGDIDSLSRFRPHSLPRAIDLSHFLRQRADQLFLLCDPTRFQYESIPAHLQSFSEVAHLISTFDRC